MGLNLYTFLNSKLKINYPVYKFTNDVYDSSKIQDSCFLKYYFINKNIIIEYQNVFYIYK